MRVKHIKRLRWRNCWSSRNKTTGTKIIFKENEVAKRVERYGIITTSRRTIFIKRWMPHPLSFEGRKDLKVIFMGESKVLFPCFGILNGIGRDMIFWWSWGREWFFWESTYEDIDKIWNFCCKQLGRCWLNKRIQNRVRGMVRWQNL